jgi:acyl-CoA thioester hydrolase
MIHRCSLSVRSYEIDAYGHVNNAVYLNYLEWARGEYLRAIGFDYQGAIDAGYGLWVVRVEIDYRVPARLHDVLEIRTWPSELKSTHGTMSQEIWRDEALCAKAAVKWAFVDRTAGRPARIPEEFMRPGLVPDMQDI